MQQGQAEFLLCHHHPAAPVRLDPAHFRSLAIGADILMPVVAPDAGGRARHDVASAAGRVPHLGYSEESGLGRILAAALPSGLAEARLETVFTSHLAAALRSMALTGRGIAWLPQSLIADDLASGRLVRAGPEALDVAVGIHLFRAGDDIGTAAERFWSQLTKGAA
jgi:DNA-binding transcriptional LysR family regulator